MCAALSILWQAWSRLIKFAVKYNRSCLGSCFLCADCNYALLRKLKKSTNKKNKYEINLILFCGEVCISIFWMWMSIAPLSPCATWINNYWMRLSMISWIIKTVVYWCREHRHEVLIIHDIMRKPNSIIVLLYIFHIIHPQKQKRSVQPFCFWGEHSKGLSNQTDFELDIIISAADIAFIMSSSRAIVNWLNALDQPDFS